MDWNKWFSTPPTRITLSNNERFAICSVMQYACILDLKTGKKTRLPSKYASSRRVYTPDDSAIVFINWVKKQFAQAEIYSSGQTLFQCSFKDQFPDVGSYCTFIDGLKAIVPTMHQIHTINIHTNTCELSYQAGENQSIKAVSSKTNQILAVVKSNCECLFLISRGDGLLKEWTSVSYDDARMNQAGWINNIFMSSVFLISLQDEKYCVVTSSSKKTMISIIECKDVPCVKKELFIGLRCALKPCISIDKRYLFYHACILNDSLSLVRMIVKVDLIANQAYAYVCHEARDVYWLAFYETEHSVVALLFDEIISIPVDSSEWQQIDMDEHEAV